MSNTPIPKPTILKNRKTSTQPISAEETRIKQAALEVTQGIYEADLGGHLFKKRIAKGSRGKSGGVRTIVCLRKHQRIIFLHGFAKNERSNFTRQELKVFKEFANLFLAMSETEIATAINQGDLVEL